MLELSGIAVDPVKVDKGSWWTVRMDEGHLFGEQLSAPLDDDPCVLIVPIGVGYERQLAREQEPFLDRLRSKDLPDAEREEILSITAGRAAAKKVVRGWRNLTFYGEAKAWSEDAATEILSNRQWSVLLNFCLNKASQRASVLANQEAEAAGN
jgi:hypothetical protein